MLQCNVVIRRNLQEPIRSCRSTPTGASYCANSHCLSDRATRALQLYCAASAAIDAARTRASTYINHPTQINRPGCCDQRHNSSATASRTRTRSALGRDSRIQRNRRCSIQKNLAAACSCGSAPTRRRDRPVGRRRRDRSTALQQHRATRHGAIGRRTRRDRLVNINLFPARLKITSERCHRCIQGDRSRRSSACIICSKGNVELPATGRDRLIDRNVIRCRKQQSRCAATGLIYRSGHDNVPVLCPGRIVRIDRNARPTR